MFSKLTVAFSQLSAWIFAFEPSDKSEGEENYFMSTWHTKTQ